MIAEATLGSRSTQARANWARLRPASAAIGFSRWTARSNSGCMSRWMKPPISSLVARVPGGGGPVGLVLAGEHALGRAATRRSARCRSRRRAGSPPPPAARQSSEYCGWLETNFATPGHASIAARILSAGHSEKPM